MASQSSVEYFLSQFKSKMKIFDVVFMDKRAKNTQALADLEITPNSRKKYSKILGCRTTVKDLLKMKNQKVRRCGSLERW